MSLPSDVVREEDDRTPGSATEPHLTSVTIGEWQTAGMLRQVALAALFGDAAPEPYHATCDSCPAAAAHPTHRLSVAWRTDHERAHRP